MKKMEATAKKAKSMRNAERRRERSKVAARCRRGKESEIFTELSSDLPIPESAKGSLDKASVMRLTLCNLKLKKMMGSGCWSDRMMKKYTSFNEEFDSQINSAFGGFLLVCTLDGDVTYASEGITTQLGISQYEIMGQSLFEFSHQYDHNDIRNMLSLKKTDTENNEGQKRSCLFRMKSTVTSRGRNSHLRTANYKVIYCVGRILEGDDDGERWFVSICEPLLHPSDVDVPLNKQVFLSKHTPDMKFEYVDDNVAALMGYEPDSMVGHSLFEYCHALDDDGIAKSFKSLYEKEQTQTEQYRFLTKGGGWVWVVTQATVIQSNGGKSPGSIVCMHFITSGKEETEQILATVQIGTPAVVSPVPMTPKIQVLSEKNIKIIPQVNTKKNVAPSVAQEQMVKNSKKLHNMTLEEENSFIADLLVGPLLNSAVISTNKIFAPKTKDMEKGFLMPVNNSLVVSKEEPEDLTHLAPMAGDECVPLDGVPLLEDLLLGLEDDGKGLTFLESNSSEIPTFAYTVKGNQQNLVTDTAVPVSGCPVAVTVAATVVPVAVAPSAILDTPPLITLTNMTAASTSNSGSTSLVSSPQASPSPVILHDQLWSGVNNNETTPKKRHASANETNSPVVKKFAVEAPPTDHPPLLKAKSSAIDTFLLNQANLLMQAGGTVDQGEEPPVKIPKLETNTGGQQPSPQIFILLPRQRSGSFSSSGASSSSEADSGDDSQGFELVSLVQNQDNLTVQEQEQIKSLLSNAGVNYPENSSNETESNSLITTITTDSKKAFAASLLYDQPLSFKQLTSQDCEVNAPLTRTNQLLQGPELLRALEVDL